MKLSIWQNPKIYTNQDKNIQIDHGHNDNHLLLSTMQ